MLLLFLFILRRMGKQTAWAHHTFTCFHTGRVNLTRLYSQSSASWRILRLSYTTPAPTGGHRYLTNTLTTATTTTTATAIATASASTNASASASATTKLLQLVPLLVQVLSTSTSTRY